MICPNCLSGLGTIIVRKKREFRRRKCVKCNHRFNTIEINIKEVRSKIQNAIEMIDEVIGD